MAKPLVTNDPLSVFASQIVKHQDAHTLRSSKDILIRNTPAGTSIELNRLTKIAEVRLIYRGEWDPDLFYDINDIIRVLPSKIYYDMHGNIVAVSPGTWICVSGVPDNRFTQNLGGNTTGYEAIIRQANVNYTPTHPEPQTIATLTQPNGRYWDELGGNVSTSGLPVWL